MSITISIQPGQPGEDMTYNVRKPLPYPFHIDANTGDCIRGRGTVDLGDARDYKRPWRLLGFQSGDVQTVVLTFDQFVARPQLAVGLRPVFVDHEDIFSLTEPIISAMVNDVARAGA